MSLEKTYRELMEAAANRPQDQNAEVPAGPAPTETAEQAANPGDAQAKRGKDKKATGTDDHGEKPKDTATAVNNDTTADKTAPNQTMEADETEVNDAVVETEEQPEVEQVVDSVAENVEVETPDVAQRIAEAATFSLKDELGSLLEAEGLDEEFKSKAITIFESAVNEAAKSHVASLQQEAADLIAEEVQAYKVELDEQVEKYLDFIVQEWAKENKVAIQSQVRVDIAESFMEGLKDLLETHYYELPADKADLYESQVSRTEELETELTEQVNANLDLQKELAEARKEVAVEKFVTEHAANDVEAEKIRSLAESMDFDGVDTFNTKLGTLMENYFPEQKTNNGDMIVEDADGDAPATIVETASDIDPEMAEYLKTVSQMKRKG